MTLTLETIEVTARMIGLIETEVTESGRSAFLTARSESHIDIGENETLIFREVLRRSVGIEKGKAAKHSEDDKVYFFHNQLICVYRQCKYNIINDTGGVFNNFNTDAKQSEWNKQLRKTELKRRRRTTQIRGLDREMV